ncbi:MAG: TetR/AcrR family transcriptional regulator [Chitinophagales bacterium]|nr:TetR/AcrR family transcriptional regulator [Chitinophagales bacterium]
MLQVGEEKKDIEELIKRAAKKVFAKKGFAGARLQEIADVAGIGRTSLHYYYKSKDKLFDAVITEKLSELKNRFGSLNIQNLSLEEKLIHCTKAYFSKAITDPDLDIFLLNEFNRKPEKMMALIQNHRFTKEILKDFNQAIQAGQIKGIAQQHFITFLSITFFPFAAKSMMQQMLQCNDEDYMQYMKAREAYIVDFIHQNYQSNSKK